MKGWKELDVKTKIAYISAIVAFCLGWGLTVGAFFVPVVGEISESVLWVLGQALVYAASVFGVALFTTNSVRSMRREMHHYMRHPEQISEIEEEDNEFDADSQV